MAIGVVKWLLLAGTVAASVGQARANAELADGCGDCGVQYGWYCYQPGMPEPVFNQCDKDDPGCAGWP